MTAFTPYMGGKARVFGTHGDVEDDGARSSLRDFRTKTSSPAATSSTSIGAVPATLVLATLAGYALGTMRLPGGNAVFAFLSPG
ncbi:hypothetical protein [Haloactinopolyspora sp.]|uniref:hypothetical protein n=1 Tax=Haloactinopolyspora sp. TaxID=1966353 RepID=UPI0026232AFC|nr:hypothetical protein [Haloactinopolyspora sp.]